MSFEQAHNPAEQEPQQETLRLLLATITDLTSGAPSEDLSASTGEAMTGRRFEKVIEPGITIEVIAVEESIENTEGRRERGIISINVQHVGELMREYSIFEDANKNLSVTRNEYNDPGAAFSESPEHRLLKTMFSNTKRNEKVRDKTLEELALFLKGLTT